MQKAVNFGIVYGISSFGLSMDLSITRKEAAEYIEHYFETYPGVKKFLDDSVENAKEKRICSYVVRQKETCAGIKIEQFYAKEFRRESCDECSDTRNRSRYHENCDDRCP